MKRNALFALLLSQLLIAPLALRAQNDGDADDGPTMGWSSWNTYGVNINESLIRQQANAMVSKGFKNVGYKYINIDDGYFGGRDPETGKLLIHPKRFPNGLRGIVDYIHKKGLKAGIYSDAGHNTCGSKFNGDTIGRGVGMYMHDQMDADLFFKELDFDFIKVDFCGGSWFHNDDHLVLNERERYTAIAEAIRNTGRTDVRMNACRWAYPGTWVSDVAFSWRTTGDINCSWGSVRDIIKENLYLSAYCHDGTYNDMDMLEVGRSLSVEEDKTHFGIWCIMSSPLLIGCNMADINSTALALLKNKELIALNQDPLHLQAYVCQREGECYVLVKDVETLFGNKRAFAVYNSTDEKKTIVVDFAKMDLGGTITLRDCFKKRDAGTAEGSFEVTLAPHATAIYTATAEQRLERTLYEAETAFIGNYQEVENNQALPSGIYDDGATNCSGGCKAGWLGKKADNYLEWRNVHSIKGGKYKLTLHYICGENRSATLTIRSNSGQTDDVEEKKLTSLNSGGWNNVAKKSINIHLAAGTNTIRLTNATAWMPDIDCMTLELIEADGISEVKSQEHAMNTPIYDLNGRKVADNISENRELPPGFYVTNNRKVLNK